MAAKGSKTKNDRKNRGEKSKIKELNGKEITSVKYIGANLGHGNYRAGKYVETGLLVRDANGKPIHYDFI